MKLLVTGANGFLGSYVVLEALRQGHTVRAMVRPAVDIATIGWPASDRLEVVRADLRSKNGLTDMVRGVDSAIHLAAAKSGDVYTQYAGTVVATENLLAAMTEAGVRRMVAISSFSVYDNMRASPLAAVDEQTPIEKDGLDRDAYAHTKLVQEQLIRDHAAAQKWSLVVIRPGMIWGKDNLLNAWIGMSGGSRFWIRTGAWARIPLTYVENCAEAIVMAASSKGAQGETFNIVDDAAPTQRQFTRMVLRRVAPRRIVVPVSYTLLRLTAGSIALVNKHILGNRARVPSLLVPSRLAARGRPLTYSNKKIKTVLGWKPRYTLEQGLDRSLSTNLPSSSVDSCVTDRSPTSQPATA
jgi:nucleoside-diphosphate-sugar epimerase